MKIDVRSTKSVYIEMGDWVFYIDDSTDEQIVKKWKKGTEDRDFAFQAQWEAVPPLVISLNQFDAERTKHEQQYGKHEESDYFSENISDGIEIIFCKKHKEFNHIVRVKK